LDARLPSNVRVVPILLIAIVGMIIITSQSPEAFAGAGGWEDKDNDGYSTFQGDCDDEDPERYPGHGCNYSDVEEKTDALKAKVQDLVEKKKDANKLTKKLVNVIKALNPFDTTEESIEKLLKDTNNLLMKEKITTDEHNALVTAIQTGDAENIKGVLAGIDLGGRDLKRLTKTIDKLNPDLSPDIGKACKELDGFNIGVNNLFDKDKLTVTEKDALIVDAEAIKTSLECV